MFRDHQPIISEYARQNPDKFARVLKFVVLTIRSRLFNIPAEMSELDAAESGNPSDAIDGILYGSKRIAVDYINEHKSDLFELAESAFYHADSEREAAESLLGIFAQIFGIGLAKSGFCCQLIYGVAGCLDSHNLTRFGINPNHAKSSTYKSAKTLKTKTKWIKRYMDYVERLGGTESLWDSWCEYVAMRDDITGFKMNRNKPMYESAYHVSALHVESILGGVATYDESEWKLAA